VTPHLLWRRCAFIEPATPAGRAEGAPRCSLEPAPRAKRGGTGLIPSQLHRLSSLRLPSPADSQVRLFKRIAGAPRQTSSSAIASARFRSRSRDSDRLPT